MEAKLRPLLLKSLPSDHITYCCAYGSGVFKQTLNGSTESKEKKVIDLIIAVDNTLEFHKKNMKMNRKHYSMWSKIMPWHITDFVQRNGTKLYYNPMVKFKDCEDGNTYKYGIIQHSDFMSDLNDWTEFFVAARLQKPVLQIYTKENEHDAIAKSLEINKRNALAIAILVMPKPVFTLMDLFLSITSLSYYGDIRMTLKAENPNKVKNIVEPNFEHFMNYYEDQINQFEKDGAIEFDGNSIFSIGHNNHCIQYLIDRIPHKSYMRNLIKENAMASEWDEHRDTLLTNLEIQNQSMSVRGILSGMYSTNPIKNIIYTMSKKRKAKVK